AGGAAAQEGAGPALPVGAGARRSLRRPPGLVGPLADDDLVHGGPGQPLEHAGEEEPLLGTTEARGLARREDDRGYTSHQLSSTGTLEITTGSEGGPSPTPRPSMPSTATIPSVTFP